MNDYTALESYIAEKRSQINDELSNFIKSRFSDRMMEMGAHILTGGKRLRGIMALLCCEAVGGRPEDAMIAACCVELAHASSLVKDDVIDGDETRRGGPSFWKKYSMSMALLLPDVLVPHAVVFTGHYGLRAMKSVADAWRKVAQGQLMDFPQRFGLLLGSYEQIIELKTASLFAVACELGIRAAKRDWLVAVAHEYGHQCGMAFQVYDDYCDLVEHINQPWASLSPKQMPTSMAHLKELVGKDSDTIEPSQCAATVRIARGYLDAAERAAEQLPQSEVQPLLKMLPGYCCQSLVAESEAKCAEKALSNESADVATASHTD